MIYKYCTRKCTRNARFQADFGRFSFSVFLVFVILKILIFRRFSFNKYFLPQNHTFFCHILQEKVGRVQQ